VRRGRPPRVTFFSVDDALAFFLYGVLEVASKHPEVSRTFPLCP
jgi:hypothetical protein